MNRVEAWRQSGQSSREFCAGRGYAAKTLLWYSSRLGRETKKSRTAMVRVRRAEAPAPTPILVEVDGARVHVSTGADGATLTTVFEALRGARS